jgi:hypothetical protein
MPFAGLALKNKVGMELRNASEERRDSYAGKVPKSGAAKAASYFRSKG